MRFLKISGNFVCRMMLWVGCFNYFTAAAQTGDSARDAINHILAPIDKNQIPTGILAENCYNLVELSHYNGQLNTTNNLGFSQLRMGYTQLLTGAYTVPIGLPSITQLNTDYNAALTNGNIVSIALINYASIKADAFTNNLLQITNDQVYDVPNRPASPYQTNTFFAAAAANNKAKNGRYSIYIPGTL